MSDSDITSLLLQPIEWQRRAACAELDVDPEIFFPERGASAKPAKAICARCSVVNECLTYALETKAEFGIWGNTSERERRQLRRRTDALISAMNGLTHQNRRTPSLSGGMESKNGSPSQTPRSQASG